MTDVNDEPEILSFKKTDSDLESNQIPDESSHIQKDLIEIKEDSNLHQGDRVVSFMIGNEKTDTSGAAILPTNELQSGKFLRLR